jgi:hypothetical protein
MQSAPPRGGVIVIHELAVAKISTGNETRCGGQAIELFRRVIADPHSVWRAGLSQQVGADRLEGREMFDVVGLSLDAEGFLNETD